jgi:HSP20 family protein
MEQRMSPEEIERNKEVIRQQQEWINRAVGLATDWASELAQSEKDREEIRKQKAWLNRAFGLASDVATGSSSPRYEIDDSETAFQIALDVPGVKPEDIDIQLEDDGKVLTIKGQRQVGPPSASRQVKFSKSFSLDPTVDGEKITASLNNGVLLVSAPKEVVNPDEKIKKIPVMQFSDVDVSEETMTESKASVDPLEAPVPEPEPEPGEDGMASTETPTTNEP